MGKTGANSRRNNIKLNNIKLMKKYYLYEIK
jgi:hypothetical protein